MATLMTPAMATTALAALLHFVSHDSALRWREHLGRIHHVRAHTAAHAIHELGGFAAQLLYQVAPRHVVIEQLIHCLLKISFELFLRFDCLQTFHNKTL